MGPKHANIHRYSLSTLLGDSSKAFDRLVPPLHKRMVDILTDYFAMKQQAVRDYLCEKLGDHFYRSFPDIHSVIAVPTTCFEADKTHITTIRSAWTRNEFDDRLILVNSQEATLWLINEFRALNRNNTIHDTPVEDTTILTIEAGSSTIELTILKWYQIPLQLVKLGHRLLPCGSYMLSTNFSGLISKEMLKGNFDLGGSDFLRKRGDHGIS